MLDWADIVLLPDAGPLITLGYADALELLLKPGWSLSLVDMVLEEVTRTETPTSRKLAAWANDHELPVIPTRVFRSYQRTRASSAAAPASKANFGELAIQEAMNDFALASPPKTGIFLFEDHKVARASFLLPENCRKASTRAFLIFLEQEGWLSSAFSGARRLAELRGRNRAPGHPCRTQLLAATLPARVNGIFHRGDFVHTAGS